LKCNLYASVAEKEKAKKKYNKLLFIVQALFSIDSSISSRICCISILIKKKYLLEEKRRNREEKIEEKRIHVNYFLFPYNIILILHDFE
jgi:hypothetical protein